MKRTTRFEEDLDYQGRIDYITRFKAELAPCMEARKGNCINHCGSECYMYWDCMTECAAVHYEDFEK